MDSTVGILGVMITTLGAVAVALIQRGRTENKKDHGFVIERLDKIDGKLTSHIRSHKNKPK